VLGFVGIATSFALRELEAGWCPGRVGTDHPGGAAKRRIRRFRSPSNKTLKPTKGIGSC
jgi:hypothetical protein